ncbi:MAG: hypothetical protein ACRDRX_04435 [Pseudonocardiaceae bacterium]
MSTGSSLVAFKRALVQALKVRPGLSEVQITYDYPDAGLTGLDIWLGHAESDNQIAGLRSGTKKVDEDYTLTVIAQALLTAGEGQEAADVAASGLLAEVQQQLAETPRITPEIMWALLAGWTHSSGSYADGGNTSRGSRFEIRVQVRARLSA